MKVRTRRTLVPMVGGLTAAATGAAAMGPVAHLATAGAEQGGASLPLGAAGLAGTGAFESCSAYFGFGKDEAVLGLVQFDVADVSGADALDHTVPADTGVVLVLENTEGALLECTPFELTEEQWTNEFEGDPLFPAYPGPGHYVYPSVNLHPILDGFGEVVAAGFRVVTIPGEHSLVSPTGTEPLAELFLDPDEMFFGTLVDPRVLDLIEAEVSAAAATLYDDALAACEAEEPIDGTDPVLIDGAMVLSDLIDFFAEEPTEVNCFDIQLMHAAGSLFLGIFESVENSEAIALSVPDAPTPPPAAQPVTIAPSFTG